jgi:hypothetical protein
MEPRYVTTPLMKMIRKSRDVRSGATSTRMRVIQRALLGSPGALMDEVWQDRRA